MTRRKLDFYPTPGWATEELIKRVSLSGRVFECCVGQGDMSKVLEDVPGLSVFTNDIDTSVVANYHADAADFHFWDDAFVIHESRPDWVVTNPPFNVAIEIVKNAHLFAKKGVAMLLRLSFLEPTKDRVTFLNKYPPTQMVVLPRISFTGDGKTDSVTCSWLTWDLERVRERNIIIAENPKFVIPAGLLAA